jgi:carboxylate-amine ligase
VEDTIAIAALYRCLVRHLVNDPALNRAQTGASRAIVEENCWRAQRYGIHGSFVDEATRSAKPLGQVLNEVIDMVEDDALALGCRGELDLARWILARGTSADQQLNLYTEGLGRGLSNRDALAGVVDWLSAETTGQPAVAH